MRIRILYILLIFVNGLRRYIFSQVVSASLTSKSYILGGSVLGEELDESSVEISEVFFLSFGKLISFLGKFFSRKVTSLLINIKFKTVQSTIDLF